MHFNIGHISKTLFSFTACSNSSPPWVVSQKGHQVFRFFFLSQQSCPPPRSSVYAAYTETLIVALSVSRWCCSQSHHVTSPLQRNDSTPRHCTASSCLGEGWWDLVGGRWDYSQSQLICLTTLLVLNLIYSQM